MDNEELDRRIAMMETDMPYTLDPHQKVGAKFIYTHKNIILADKMGLGKTATAIVGAELGGHLQHNTLIPCTKSALSVWPAQFETWMPKYLDRLVVIEGSKAKRTKIWNSCKGNEIIVATHNVISQDIDIVPPQWNLIIADEAHKYMRSHKTISYKHLQSLERKQEIIITGTPASKGVLHMFGYLHALYPKRFASYWAFINRYLRIDEGAFGQEILGAQNMDELRSILSTIMLRRMMSAGMPTKHRRRFPIQMNAEERKVYDTIDKTNIWKRGDDSYLLSPSEMSNQLRLRQLLVCPKLIDPNLGPGSGIEAVMTHIDDQELGHAVIFSPFASAFPFLEECIVGVWKKPAYILKGGMDAATVKKTIQAWEKTGGIMLCSIQFATSFDLTKASTAYMLGMDWDPDNNYQAEDRIHRRSSVAEDVIIYYVLHDTVLIDNQLNIMNAKTAMTYHDNKEFIPESTDR